LIARSTAFDCAQASAVEASSSKAAPRQHRIIENFHRRFDRVIAARRSSVPA
jgi:hypothetical protein